MSKHIQARVLGACVILLIVLLVAGCANQTRTSGTAAMSAAPPVTAPRSTPSTASASAPRQPATPTPSTSQSTLSPLQMAGQRVIYGYPGLTPPADLLALISHGEAAGVIFFSDNIVDEAQLRAVVQELEGADASPDNPVRAPLLLMIDQEGGQVRRLPGEPLLSEKQIGASADPAAAATKAGAGAGLNLRSIGLNVNLAPILDVYRSAGDFDDQYGRSYSMNSAVTSELGVDFIRSQQAEGVAACAKHFPGLGAATAVQNTDNGPVTLEVPPSSLAAIDEPPFSSAIAAGVKLVMVSWAIYPALDPGMPAGLSSVIVQGQLREALGFKGVTITDGLVAGALKPYGTIGHRAQLAAAAGMDLLLCAKTGSPVSVGVSAMDALRDDYVNGTLDKPAFQASVQRIIALRHSLGD